jgi:hypothetical protein
LASSNWTRPTAIRSESWCSRDGPGGPRGAADRGERPDEMADLAMTMLRTGYLTNKVITVDGGLIAR